MRLFDFHCMKCGLDFEEIVVPDVVTVCKGCQGLDIQRVITAPKIYIMRSQGASTSPARFNHYESRRKEAKHERVMTKLIKDGLSEKNNTAFVDPKKARKR